MTPTVAPLPTSARAIANREKIYHAAITLIEQHGLDATTMDEIAVAANMSRSSVFNHFPNKISFVAEFFQRFTREVIGAASDANIDGFRNRLEALCAAIRPIAYSNKGMTREFAKLAMGGGPLESVEHEADDLMGNFFRDIIKEGIASKEIRSGLDQEVLANFLLGILTVTTHDWVNNGQQLSLQVELSTRFNLLFEGIAGDSVS